MSSICPYVDDEHNTCDCEDCMSQAVAREKAKDRSGTMRKRWMTKAELKEAKRILRVTSGHDFGFTIDVEPFNNKIELWLGGSGVYSVDKLGEMAIFESLIHFYAMGWGSACRANSIRVLELLEKRGTTK